MQNLLSNQCYSVKEQYLFHLFQFRFFISQYRASGSSAFFHSAVCYASLLRFIRIKYNVSGLH